MFVSGMIGSEMSRDMELVALKMIEMGLAPPPPLEGLYYKSDPVKHVRETLASLSPKERRRAVRKFRKLHRKARKKSGYETEKGKAPSVYEKRRRITSVVHMIEDEVVKAQTSCD